MQGKSNISGYFEKQGPLFLIYSKLCRDRNRKQTINPSLVFQPDGLCPSAIILFHERTILAGGGRILYHCYRRLCERLLYVYGQLSLLKSFHHELECLAQPCFGGRYKPSGLIQQSDPCVMVAACCNKIITSALKQFVPVLLLCDKLVNISDGTKHEVEMRHPLLQMLALCDVTRNHEQTLTPSNDCAFHAHFHPEQAF